MKDRGNLWGAAQANNTSQVPALPTGLALSSQDRLAAGTGPADRGGLSPERATPLSRPQEKSP